MHGGFGQGNAFEKHLTFIKGEDHMAGFRCAVKDKGTAFLEKKQGCCQGFRGKSLTAYASCCGTIAYVEEEDARMCVCVCV